MEFACPEIQKGSGVWPSFSAAQQIPASQHTARNDFADNHLLFDHFITAGLQNDAKIRT
jgi:hypothetical protein